MIFSTFFSSLVSTGIVTTTLYSILLFIEGALFLLVSYSYKLFSLMCQLNFNSLYALVAPLMDRLKAVIMVLVVFKLGITLIQVMMEPEKLIPKGKDLLKNIVITAILLLSYNLVFTILNEFSMLILGTPPGYSFTALKEIAGVTDGEDEGLIMRFVFGDESDISNIGDFIAFKSVQIFVRDTTTDNTLEKTLLDGDSYNFMNLPNISSKINKTVEYTPFVGILLGIFLVYTFLNITGEIGIRMFKLLILQMMAPLAIITVIDKGWNSDIFKKYRGEYLKIYTSVFVRILSILVVTVFVAKFLTNIGDFFGTTTSVNGNGLTKCLISLIVIFAGYKFVLDIPDLIKNVFGIDIKGSSGKGGFASVLGGMLAGGLAGAAGGFASGATFGQKLGGALAGTATGLGKGAYNSSKGTKISETVKKIGDQTDGWQKKGGIGNVAYGAMHNAIGTTRRQNRQMQRYTAAQTALDAYDKARIEAIKDTKVSNEDLSRANLENAYKPGYDDVKYSDSKDGFVSKMLDYDKEYRKAQDDLDKAMQSGDSNDISDKRDILIEKRKQATKRAEDLYEHKKATISNDKITRTRKEAIIANRNAGTLKGNKEKGEIFIKKSKEEIGQKQENLQEKKSYRTTHND